MLELNHLGIFPRFGVEVGLAAYTSSATPNLATQHHEVPESLAVMKFTPYFLALAVLVPKVASILENYAVFSEYRPWLQDMTNMPYPQWTSGRRAWGTVPKTCMDEATETGVCDPYEIYVYEIRYTDVCISTPPPTRSSS